MAAATSGASVGMADGEWPLTASAYTLQGVVGEGAFAKVHKATCTTNGEVVAVKIIELDKVQTPIEIIMNEVRTMAMCRHKHVLPLLACFVDGANLWLVSPLMAKGSAFWLVRMVGRTGSSTPDQPCLPEAAIRVIIKGTLEGLTYLHGQKQIHRDIKAGNILIDESGCVKIGDFGVAGWMGDDLSRTDGKRDTFVGTPCWMAPEVMEHGKGYNERADVWSVGITAMELAMGKAPYATLAPMMVLMETLNKDPPTIDTYKASGVPVPRLSADFHRFVARCLVKDPTKRPSASELLTDRFVARVEPSALLSVTETLGKVGPESAAALGDKPGYEAASIARPEATKFADGTTWVFWEGSGSVAKDSRRKVEESAVTVEAFAQAFEGIEEGEAGGEGGDDDDDEDAVEEANSLAVRVDMERTAAPEAVVHVSTAPTGPRVLFVGPAPSDAETGGTA